MSITVGDLHLAITTALPPEIERTLRQVDTAATAAAAGVGKTDDALKKTADAGKLTARQLAETWGVFNKTADAADDLAKTTSTATTEMSGLASALGPMAMSGALSVAVVAGVSALAAIYDAFTESARKAKEEQKKLTNALEEWYRVQSLGPGGQRQQQVRAEEQKLADLRKQLAEARAEEQRALTSGTAARTGTTDQLVGAARQRIRQLQSEIQQTELVIRAGGRDVVRARTEAAVDEIAAEVKNLRALEKAGLASVEQRKRLADLERNAAQLRDAYAKGPMTGVTERQRMEMILQLVDALDKEEKKTKQVKDATDARVSALVELGRQHELTYGDIQEAEQLYAAEAKVLDDSTASIERRAKALQRMKALENSGAVTRLGGAPERQGTIAPAFEGNPFDLGGVEVTGVEKLAAALHLALQGAIDAAGFEILFAEGMSEAIAAAYDGILTSGVAALATDFAAFTHDVFTNAIDAIAAGITGGWQSFKSALLGGLGSILMQMGKQLMTTGAALLGLLPALSNPFTSGGAMVAAGALIFGAGAALAAIAGGGGRAGGGSPASGGLGGLGIGGPSAPNPYAFAAGSRTTGPMVNGRAPEPRNTIVLQPTIIGINDVQAQRALRQMLTMADRRGIA